VSTCFEFDSTGFTLDGTGQKWDQTICPALPLISRSDGDEKKTRKKWREKNERRQRDILAAYHKLLGHPEPSVVREAKEIAGQDITQISDFRAQQLIDLAAEIDDEEALLLLI